MLRELKIENLAIIKNLYLEFENGFIVLTGETGAGKSIILSAINLLIGEKATIDMIRDGEEYLLAQGVFEISQAQEKALEKFDLNIENREVIVRRKLERSGKAKTYVNGIRVSMSDLKEIMSELVDIVGQHSHQMLLNKNNHIKLLDSFLSEDAKKLKIEIEEELKNYRNVEIELKKMQNERAEILEKKEFYEFQLNELKKLDLQENEEDLLEAEYKKLFSAGMIKDKLDQIIILLNDGENDVLSNLKESIKNLQNLTKIDAELENISNRLNNSYYEIEDCFSSLMNINSNLDMDGNKLDIVGKRLELIKSYKNKYKRNFNDLYNLKITLEQKLNDFDEGFFKIDDLEKKVKLSKDKYFKLAKKLSDERKKIANLLENNLEEELKFLNMQAAKLKIEFKEKNILDMNGIDDIEFLISTNVGQKLKGLAKIASGGEVSRVMLALKVIFSKVDNIPILIFDEIDTGVGGETVKRIANKLEEVGHSAQVISITHSPAIAAVANQQFFIEKKVIKQETITTVSCLNKNDRIKEIARMLVGENANQQALEVAKNMLKY